ncbi:MAG: hypothetical protein LAC69_01845, partial [Chlorobium sp.]|nr:hypothetical protein [Chlorobium sp.]
YFIQIDQSRTSQTCEPSLRYLSILVSFQTGRMSLDFLLLFMVAPTRMIKEIEASVSLKITKSK